VRGEQVLRDNRFAYTDFYSGDFVSASA